MALAQVNKRQIKQRLYALKRERVLALQENAEEKQTRIEREIQRLRMYVPKKGIVLSEEVGKYNNYFFESIGYSIEKYVALLDAGYTMPEIANEWEIEKEDIKKWVREQARIEGTPEALVAKLRGSVNGVSIKPRVRASERFAHLREEINERVRNAEELQSIAKDLGISKTCLTQMRTDWARVGLYVEKIPRARKNALKYIEYFERNATTKEISIALNVAEATVRQMRKFCRDNGLLTQHT